MKTPAGVDKQSRNNNKSTSNTKTFAIVMSPNGFCFLWKQADIRKSNCSDENALLLASPTDELFSVEECSSLAPHGYGVF